MYLTIDSVRKWRVYKVYDELGELVYMNAAKLPDIVALRNISCARSFNPLMTYKVVIGDKEYDKKTDAMNDVVKNIPYKTPKFNLEVRGYMNDRFIVCDQTNEIFRSQYEACQRYGINKSNLSNHLRDRNLIRTVKGFSFHYYNALDEQRQLMKKWTPLMYNVSGQYWGNFDAEQVYKSYKYRHPLDDSQPNKPAFNYTPWAPIIPDGNDPIPPEALRFLVPGQTPLPVRHCNLQALYETEELPWHRPNSSRQIDLGDNPCY